MTIRKRLATSLKLISPLNLSRSKTAPFNLNLEPTMNAPVKSEAMADVVTAPHVFQAINAVMAEVSREGIAKGRKNEQQGYKFRGIDDVYNALAPILARSHLVITPRCLSRSKEMVPTKSGGSMFYVTVDVEFTLASAIDGSVTLAQMFGEAMDSGDKATNKAMSAAYKYMAMQVFCIPTEGDNDADASSHPLATAEELATNHLRGCAIDKAVFADCWNKNKANWRQVLSDEAYRRVVDEMKRLAEKLDADEKAAAPKPEPKPDFGIGEDEIPDFS